MSWSILWGGNSAPEDEVYPWNRWYTRRCFAPGACSGSKTPGVYRPLWKPEKSAPFSHEKRDIFRICLRYKANQLSWVIFISQQSQKSWKEKFLEFFQLCTFFFKVRKSTSSLFLCLVFLADNCQIKAGIQIFGPLDSQLSKMTANCEQ